MEIVCWNLTALTIAALFYGWRDGYVRRSRREKTLRERVTYMLWVATQQPT